MFKDFNTYSENQTILNSDRVILNAKKDNVFILSKDSICLSSGNSVHINIGDVNNNSKDCKFIINSPKIELGLNTKGTLEPIAKADSTEEILNTILGSISDFSNQLQTATGTGVGVVNIIALNAAANKLSKDISNISKQLYKIKSKTSYTI